jgi:hypothetical protein
MHSSKRLPLAPVLAAFVPLLAFHVPVYAACTDVPPVSIGATSDCPLEAGGTCLALQGVSPSASAVRIYGDGELIREIPIPCLYDCDITPLIAGQRLWATQVINGVEGCMASDGPAVGSGANSAIRIALGIRETGQTSGGIGSDGGTIGTIEWVGAAEKIGTAPVGKLIQPQFAWQTVTFNCCSGSQRDPVVPATGNGVVDGRLGVLESLAFTIEPPYDTGRYLMYLDSIMNGPTMLMNFDMIDLEGFSQVMFRKPSFYDTPAGNLLAYPDVAKLEGTRSTNHSLRSYRVEFQFRDGAPGRWARLTTFDSSSTPDIPYQNPLVDLNQPISLKLLLVPAGSWGPTYDSDGDSDVDMMDFAELQRCISVGPGPGGMVNDLLPGCESQDYDLSGTVDYLDLGLFEGCFSGAEISAALQCQCQ